MLIKVQATIYVEVGPQTTEERTMANLKTVHGFGIKKLVPIIYEIVDEIPQETEEEKSYWR